MKRLLFRAAMMLLIMVVTTTTAGATITGSGTQQDPYIIHDASDWNLAGQDMNYYYNNGTHVYIELAADINFKNGTFKRFGQNPNYSTPGDCYIHFDGKGFTISGISMSQGSNNFAAPFGDLAKGSTISNLTVASSSFTADSWVAGITCKNNGTIDNCHVESTVTLTANKSNTSQYCGGIAAQHGTGTISNCTVGAKFVLANRLNQPYFGGIVGCYKSSTVSGCLCYSSNVTANLNYFNSIIGGNTNSENVTGNYYRPVGSYGHGTPSATAVRAVSGIPSGVTCPAICVSHGGYDYIAENSTFTLTAPAYKAFNDDFSVSGTGASCALASNKTSASVTIASADVTINASLRSFTYTVVFNGNGSTSGSMSNQLFEYSIAQNLSVLGFSRKGYDFIGWATTADGTVAYADQQNVSNLTTTDGGTFELHAQWKPVNYTITYHENGGTLSTTKNSFTIESATITLDQPTRAGYTFGGWYKNSGLTGTPVTTIDAGSTENKEFWAKWTLDTYTITYCTNGGTLTTEQNAFTVLSDDITLDAPTRSSSTFEGWYDNETFTGSPVTTIAHGSWGHKTLYAKWTLLPGHFVEEGSAYTIVDADGWHGFCDALLNPANNGFDGKTVLLDADIEVSRMAGSSGHDFSGTFDGCGHKLTVNLNGTGKYTAPFFYLKPQTSDATVTVCNLKVDGTITTAYRYAGGIVGGCHGQVSIRNCQSSVTILSSTSGDGTHGGLVGRMASSGTLTLAGCAFTGKLLTTGQTDTEQCGGLLGWSGTVNIANCLYAPAALADGEKEVKAGSSDPNATFARPGSATVNISNSYYTRVLGTAQGTASRTISATDDIATMTVSPKGDVTATYNVSNITAYAHGLYCGETLYCGEGDELNLTLSHIAIPDFYVFNSYAVSSGTLSGTDNDYTLTMPGADVTVGAVIRSDGQAHEVSYLKADGTIATTSAIPLDGYEETKGDNVFTTIPLASGTYFVGHSFTYNYPLKTSGDITFILGDGCTMNVKLLKEGEAMETNKLIIYGQSLGTGQLNTNQWFNTAGGEYCQHSGNVNIKTTAGWGINTHSFTLDGGTLNIESSGSCIFCDIAYVLGGKLNATAGPYDYGVWANGNTEKLDVLTLGWRNATDQITVSRYGIYDNTNKFLNIAPALCYEDGGMKCILSGRLTDVEIAAIGGKTLRPYTEAVEGVTCVYNASTHTLTLSGTGNMTDLTADTQPWKNYRTDIRRVIIEPGVTAVGAHAFDGCTSLTTVIVRRSEAVPSLGTDAFANCADGLNIYVPAVKFADYQSAWTACADKLQPLGYCGVSGHEAELNWTYDATTCTLTLLGSGTMATYEWGEEPWKDYRADIKKIFISSDVKSISEGVFSGLPALTNFTVEEGNTVFSTLVYSNFVFNDALKAKGGDLLVQFPAGSSTTELVFKEQIKDIGNYAFAGCTGLKSVIIPATIPLASIGDHAFEGCMGLNRVIIDRASVPALGAKAFANCPHSLTIYVPMEQVDDYKTAANWSAYASKIKGFNTCGESTYWTYDSATTTLTIFGKGQMTDYSSLSNRPWHSFAEDITSVVIEPGVTKIGGFKNCTALTSVAIGNTVETIYINAFNGCESLTSIEIPASVTMINPQAFQGCSNLESVTCYARTVPSLGNMAFSNNKMGRTFFVLADCVEAYRTAWNGKIKTVNLYIQAISTNTSHRLSLADDADNTSTIIAAATAAAGPQGFTVTLQGRTLYKDGKWNTICLPFDVKLDFYLLKGAIVKKLDAETSNLSSDGTLTLNFESETTTMKAGTPYLIRWVKADDYDTADPDTRDLVNPEFFNLSTVNTSASTVVAFDGGAFVGTYSPVSFAANTKSILFLGAENKLYWPNADMTLRSCRAYFDLGTNEARKCVLNFNDDEDNTTGIAPLLSPEGDDAGASPRGGLVGASWYDLQGRRLSQKPTKAGLYINKGHKAVIK